MFVEVAEAQDLTVVHGCIDLCAVFRLLNMLVIVAEVLLAHRTEIVLLARLGETLG